PALFVSYGTRSNTGQVGARARFAHADAKGRFAAADGGYIKLLLFFSTVAQDQRRALPICNPVRPNGCPEIQAFFNNHVARIGIAPAPTVFFRQGDTDPAPLAHLTAQLGAVARPRLSPYMSGQITNS